MKRKIHRFFPGFFPALIIVMLMMSLVLIAPSFAQGQTLTLSPTSGVPGTVITITGSGFAISTAGRVWFDTNRDGVMDPGEPQVAVTTTAAGAIPAGITLTVPVLTPAIYSVRADIPLGGSVEASANFTVSTPSLSLSPSTGVAGTVTSVTGSNFALNTAGVVGFDSNGNGVIDPGEPQVAVTTTAAGAIPGGIFLTVPAVAAGAYQVLADIPSGGSVEAAASFTIPSPSVTLSPTSGVPGTTITITGSSFAPNTAGVVGFDSNGNGVIDPGEPQVAVTTTAAGAIPGGIFLTVPAVAPGTYGVRADIPLGGSVEAVASFTVSSPSITLSPTSGVPGAAITITGSGFAPNTAGAVGFDSNGDGVINPGEPQVAVTTTAAGAIPAGIILTVPAVAPGTYGVRADIPLGLPVEAVASFTVPSPSITLSPTSGVPGRVITITGSGFALNTVGVVGFDSNGNGAIDPGEPQVAVTTTAAGAIPAGINLTVPAVAAGAYQVLADIPSGGSVEASANFTVSARSIALSPASGTSGTAITITGSGFALSTVGVVGFDSNGNGAIDPGEPQVAVTTTAAGAIPTGIILTVPAVAAGAYQVLADIPSGGSVEASANFTIPSPSVTLSPTSGVPGRVITITGTNFALNTAGVIWFDSNGNGAIDPGEPQAAVTTTAAGAIPAGITLTVPVVTPGIYSVRADIPLGGSVEASANFTVSTPSLSLSPITGAAGTVISVTGSNFALNTAGVVGFDSNGNGAIDPGEPQVAVTTTAAGAIPAGIILTVPAVAAGVYQVLADIPVGVPVEASASFTVPSPSVTLTPNSGVPGAVITITGSGFAPNTAGAVGFDSNGNGVINPGEPQVAVTTTAAGAIPAGITLTVPAVAPGAFQVLADIPLGVPIEAVASFAVSSTSITLSAILGVPGTVITITGSGYAINTAGRVWFDTNRDGVMDPGEPQLSVTTTAAGAIPAGITLTVPVVTPGIYSVRADIPLGGSVEASANFTVSTPSLSLSPITGVAGTVISVTGSNFALNTAGVVGFDSNGNGAIDPGEPQVAVTTTAAGAIPGGIFLTVPAVAPGAYQVLADIPLGLPVEAVASFTIPSPSVVLTPNSGVPGRVITITGSGFAPNTTGAVAFDSNGDGVINPGEPQVAVTTTAAGAIPAGITLTVPAVAPGAFQVLADIPLGLPVEAVASFTIPSPSVILSPTSGVSGAVITITGSGFALNTGGVVGFDSNGNGAIDPGEPQVAVTTTAAGAIPVGIILTVPAVAPGTYGVLADIPLGVPVEAVASFTIPSPSVTLTPNSGVPGRVITITGSGFAPNTAGAVGFDSNGDGVINPGEPQVSVTTTAAGAIPAGIILTVPAVTPGTYGVRADIPLGGSVEASANFTVSTPSLSLSPITGVAGTVISVTGSNFALNTAGVVGFDSNGNGAIDPGEPQVAVTTTVAGAMAAGITLTVPAVATGAYQVLADIPVGGSFEAVASFTIPSPSVVLSPTSGVPGTAITITGSGFAPNTAGAVGFDSNGDGVINPGEPQVSVTTTAAGAIPAGIILTVPAVAPGTYGVRADIPLGGSVEAAASFTVSSSSVALTPTSGVAGAAITITGSGFAPNTTGAVGFDSNGNGAIDPGEPQVAVTTTAAGAIPAGIILTVPAVASGTYGVRADIPLGGSVEAAASFTVSSSSVVLSPTSGVAGAAITITGSGFAPNTAGAVGFDSNGDGVINPGEPQVSVTTTGDGAIPVGIILTVPAVAAGAYQVLADIPLGGSVEASANFTVLVRGITLSPVSGTSGTAITITGSGFAPNTAGAVGFDSNGSGAIDPGEPRVLVNTTAAGAIPAGITLTVPAVAAGVYQVLADIPIGGSVEASAGFNVTVAPTFVSATTDVAGTVITITFDKAMASPAGKHGEFSFKIGGTVRAFSAAALDGQDAKKINLTVDGAAIAHGDVVKVSYTKGTVVAADGGVLESFTDRAVINNADNPPEIRIVSPSHGESVFGLTTIHANASDDDRIAKVEFFIDDVKLGEIAGDTAAAPRAKATRPSAPARKDIHPGRSSAEKVRTSESGSGPDSSAATASAPGSLTVFIDGDRLRKLDRRGLPSRVMDDDPEVAFVQSGPGDGLVVLFRTPQFCDDGSAYLLVLVDPVDGARTGLLMGPGSLEHDYKFSPAVQADGQGRLYGIFRNGAFVSLRRLGDSGPAQEIYSDAANIEEWLVKRDGTVLLAGKSSGSGERSLRSVSPDGAVYEPAFRPVKTDWFLEMADGMVLASMADETQSVYAGVYQIPGDSGFLGEQEAQHPLIGKADYRYAPRFAPGDGRRPSWEPGLEWTALGSSAGSAAAGAVRGSDGTGIILELYPVARLIQVPNLDRVDRLTIKDGILYLAGGSGIDNRIVVQDLATGVASIVDLGGTRIEDFVVLDDGTIQAVGYSPTRRACVAGLVEGLGTRNGSTIAATGLSWRETAVLAAEPRGLSLYRTAKDPGAATESAASPAGGPGPNAVRGTAQGPLEEDYTFNWDTTLGPNGTFRVKVVATDSSGQTASDETTVIVTNILLSLEAARVEVRAWAILRSMGSLSVTVANPGPIQVSRFFVLRKTGNGNFQVLAEIPASGPAVSGFAYQDKWLVKSAVYTYRIEAVNAAGNVVGRSADKTF